MHWNNLQDYLSFAGEQKTKAKLAIKEKRFDDAWRHLHQQKDFYAKHVNQSGGFSTRDTLSLLGTVDRDLADVLRLEGKHRQALVHLAYSFTASRHRLTKDLENKLLAFYKRCKFTNSDYDIFRKKLLLASSPVNFGEIQSIVSQQD